MALLSDRFAKNSRLQEAARNAPAMRRREGDRAAVKLLQQALSILDFPMPKSTKPNGEMDGIYGEETEHTIHLFQFEHKLFDSRGKTDGVAGKDTLHRLDKVVRPIRHAQLPVKPPVVRQQQKTCWAAAIQSATYGRHTVAELVKKYGKRDGSIDSTTLTSVGRDVGMLIFTVPVSSRNVRDIGKAILVDLTKHRKPVLLCAYAGVGSMAHCYAIYGIDGVGGKLTLIRNMDPQWGDNQARLEFIIRVLGKVDLVVGTQARALRH